MKIAESGVQVSERFLDDVRMADWQRLGRYVVARREELGYKQRGDIASAVGVSTRVMSDIENGRRGNFDRVTIAALERALGWETGSVERVATGGEPRLRGSLSRSTPVGQSGQSDLFAMIAKIDDSSMGPTEKLEAIKKVLRINHEADLSAERDEVRQTGQPASSEG